MVPKSIEISVPVQVRGRIRMIVPEPASDTWTEEMVRELAVEEVRRMGGEIDLRGAVHFIADFNGADIGQMSVIELGEAVS